MKRTRKVIRCLVQMSTVTLNKTELRTPSFTGHAAVVHRPLREAFYFTPRFAHCQGLPASNGFGSLKICPAAPDSAVAYTVF